MAEDNPKSALMNQFQINAQTHRGEIDHWKVMRYEDFRKNILDDQSLYPCFFAVEAERRGMARYLFINSVANSEDLLKLRDGLYDYVKNYKSIGKRTTLVIFFKPSEEILSAEKYKKQFWKVIQFLHENDPEPWPANIPIETEHPQWEFCFGGEPMFMVARSPIYSSRRSRYTPYGLEITIQPRGALEDITGDTKGGQEARNIIRQRLTDYDDIPPHPDIGDYGVSDSREWKQYVLPETNEESVIRCPFTGKQLND